MIESINALLKKERKKRKKERKKERICNVNCEKRKG